MMAVPFQESADSTVNCFTWHGGGGGGGLRRERGHWFRVLRRKRSDVEPSVNGLKAYFPIGEGTRIKAIQLSLDEFWAFLGFVYAGASLNWPIMCQVPSIALFAEKLR